MLNRRALAVLHRRAWLTAASPAATSLAGHNLHRTRFAVAKSCVPRLFSDAAKDAPQPEKKKVKFILGDAVAEILACEHAGRLIFPEYMHAELTKRTIQRCKAQVTVLKSQGVRVTRAKLDEVLLDVVCREGCALADNDEDRVFITCPTAPGIGEIVELEEGPSSSSSSSLSSSSSSSSGKATGSNLAGGKRPGKVVGRHLMQDDTQLQLVLKVAPLTKDGTPTDGLVSQLFDVQDGNMSPVDEEKMVERNRVRMQKIAKSRYDLAVREGEGRQAQLAHTEADVDRVLYEDMLKKDAPADPSDEQRKDMRVEFEGAMMSEYQAEMDAVYKRKDKEKRAAARAARAGLGGAPEEHDSSDDEEPDSTSSKAATDSLADEMLKLHPYVASPNSNQRQ